MSRMMENKARERRIELEAVVDAYNESERRWVGITTLKRG
jgi:endonuclease I